MHSEYFKSNCVQYYWSRALSKRYIQWAMVTLAVVSTLCFMFKTHAGMLFSIEKRNCHSLRHISQNSSQNVDIEIQKKPLVTQDPFFNFNKLKERLEFKCKTYIPTKDELMKHPYRSWAVSRFMAYYNIVKYLNMRWQTSRTNYDINVLDVGGSRFLKSLDVKLNITRTDNPGIDIHNTGFVGSQFDAVVADQVLEHLTYPPLAMLEIHRILKPGGLAVLTTVAYNPLHEHSTFHDLWRFFPDGLRVLSAPFEGGIKLCGSWGTPNFIAARATFGLGSGKEKRYVESERIKMLTSNSIQHPFLVWIVIEK